MKRTVLLYLLVLLFTCCCSNNTNKNERENGGLLDEVEAVFEKSPKDIQPEGTFVAKDNKLYKSLTFKGKRTVVIHDAIFGMDFPSEYDKDEEFLRVKTDKSDLLFEIISEDTIKGEGFAKGLYIKK